MFDNVSNNIIFYVKKKTFKTLKLHIFIGPKVVYIYRPYILIYVFYVYLDMYLEAKSNHLADTCWAY